MQDPFTKFKLLRQMQLPNPLEIEFNGQLVVFTH